MLELTKKNIHMDCIKAKAGNQITIEDDVNIPDLRPDIDKVIFQSGIIRLEEVRPGNDQVGVKGSLAVHVLYQSEEEEEPFSKIETELPFDELFHMDGVEASDSVCVRYELEDLSVGVINSRKISVRALVTLELLARAIYDECAATDVNAEITTEYRKKPLHVLETTVCKKDVFRFRHEETLPGQYPNILEILYGSVMPVNMECVPEEGKLAVRGNMQLFFMYTPDGEEDGSQNRLAGLLVRNQDVLRAHGLGLGEVLRIFLIKSECLFFGHFHVRQHFFHRQLSVNVSLRFGEDLLEFFGLFQLFLLAVFLPRRSGDHGNNPRRLSP